MIHGMQYGGFLARADLRAYEHAPRSITHTVFGGTCNSVAFTQAFGGGRRELLRLEQEGMLPDPNSLPSLFVGTEQMLLDEGICNVNRDGKGWPAVATAPGELIHLMGPAYLTDFKPIWRRNYHAWMEYAAKSGARVLIWVSVAHRRAPTSVSTMGTSTPPLSLSLSLSLLPLPVHARQRHHSERPDPRQARAREGTLVLSRRVCQIRAQYFPMGRSACRSTAPFWRYLFRPGR
mmetsp:Transcript_26437/g.70674  ORF Transcript_26437/g.70674 Transcript_26437/m.70674 type:complete len:234 (-) Transcript_26437:734-1435(-)